MKKILLLSDTHSCQEPDILKYFDEADELWHAGDWGESQLSALMQDSGKTIRGVYGNIDGPGIRGQYPAELSFETEGLKVYMTHIGGYPGKYNSTVLSRLRDLRPGLFVCGHSHILRVMRDKHLHGMLHMNPGAAGRHGFHAMRTMLRFSVNNGAVIDVSVIELGKRTAGITPEIQ